MRLRAPTAFFIGESPMAIKTQGTHLYIIDPDASAGEEILRIECGISLDGISAPRDQIETTCLEDFARQYESGMPTPGQMTVGLNFDPAKPSHLRLYELWRDGTKFDMAIAYSDGTAAPTLASDGASFDFPTTRSYLELLNTYVADIPQNVALNAVVTANVSFQLSGFPTLYKKA